MLFFSQTAKQGNVDAEHFHHQSPHYLMWELNLFDDYGINLEEKKNSITKWKQTLAIHRGLHSWKILKIWKSDAQI